MLSMYLFSVWELVSSCLLKFHWNKNRNKNPENTLIRVSKFKICTYWHFPRVYIACLEKLMNPCLRRDHRNSLFSNLNFEAKIYFLDFKEIWNWNLPRNFLFGNRGSQNGDLRDFCLNLVITLTKHIKKSVKARYTDVLYQWHLIKKNAVM